MDYSDNDYKTILGHLLRISMENVKPTKDLIEKMFEDPEFRDPIIRLCRTYLKPEHRKARLVAKTMDIRALKAMNKICERDNLGMIPLDFSGDEDAHYEQGDRIHILFLSSQEDQINLAVAEAGAVSGTIPEMKKKIADKFSGNLNDNPMLQFQNVSESTYRTMLKKVESLPVPMQFTLFPDRKEDGTVNVGFLSKTQEIKVRKMSKTTVNGPYNIPKMASVILASSLLEDRSNDKQYEEKKKQERELQQMLLDAYYDSDAPFYLVPATMTREGNCNVFMDRSLYFDFYQEDAMTYEEYKEIVESSHGINHLWLLMTGEEYARYENEVVVSVDEIESMKEKEVSWMPPEMEKRDLSEKLIDSMNRKRESILLASDDFNGNNLAYLADYAYVSVNELIVREDEEFSGFTEGMELEEISLLETLHEKYPLHYAYGDYDKVTELINKERTPVVSREKEEPEEEFEL